MATLPGETPIITVTDLELCPTSGDFCPARENLIRLYSEYNPDIVVNLGVGFSKVADEAKLSIKLAEMSVRARTLGCEGQLDGACPVRDQMDSSSSRRTAVNLVRGLRNTLSTKRK